MYECGRDNEHKVEKFIKKAEIIECLKEIGASKKNYLLFSSIYGSSYCISLSYYGGKRTVKGEHYVRKN